MPTPFSVTPWFNSIGLVGGSMPEGAAIFRELDLGQSALLTDIAMCINYYRLFSPGLYCCVHATVQLSPSLHGVPLGCSVSVAGQVGVPPGQTSAASHSFTAGRQVVSAPA